ncbi:NAD(P)-dependent oxidoreductase [Marisediminicola senii]|uniref:NAD(P)-dependent oxidoreductase n=1 Tax=Marisediminicola senii TaxID=2711233 RepID=UPI0013EB6B3F|nr:NAD(P)-dependent oxidoreductase [Marisediminicola senii]
MKVALLGTGRMGTELGRHLPAAGHDLRVYNRTPGRVRELVAMGASAEPTAGDAAAGADVVLSVLFGPDAVRDLVVCPYPGIPAGSLWIDVTTVGPNDAREFAGWAGSKSIRYVHSPVIGSLGPARAGALGVLLGGESSAIDDAVHLTALWSDPARVFVFDTPASAAATKLAVNLGLAVAIEGLAEALELGRTAGVDTEVLLDVLGASPLGAVVGAKRSMIASGDFRDAHFTVNALAKDISLAMAVALTPPPALGAAAGALHGAQRAGRGEWDFSVIAALA